MESVANVQKLLHSKLRLERDKGIVELQSILSKEGNEDAVKSLLSNLQKELVESNEASDWEIIHGSLLGIKYVLNSSVKKNIAEAYFPEANVQMLREFSLKALQHREVRVRNQAGELLGALCIFKGSAVYRESRDQVLRLLRGDLERHIEADVPGQSEENLSAPTSPIGSDAANIFHESAGWRYLETTMKCLRYMIEGCSKGFNPFITQELLDLLFSALTHTNRFVRETGFNVCSALVQCGSSEDSESCNSVFKYGEQLSHYLAKGLADNWSQVRLASSVATRTFLLSFLDPQKRELYYTKLIPRLCLNRYYIAEGVRIYSQDTWKMVSEGHGKDLVEKYISDVASYYIEATQADNHAVREAACACISELATKIKPEAVRDHVSSLLAALLDCFQDDSWPVRDAACVACGNFILSYGAEAKGKRGLLYELFLSNLRDPIPSVREGAGVALAKYVKAYGDEVLPDIIKEIKEGFDEVKNQPENSDKFTGLDKRPAQFGVVRSTYDSSSELDKSHTDQQMYSCGSLAPKMGRGNKGGCSGGGGFRRPSEPWERSDGCVYLVTELSSHYPQQTSSLLPAIVSALSHKHYSQHLVFLETVCRQLPKIAQRIGKRAFKMHLESFLNPIFEGLRSDIQLTVAASEECLMQLGKLLGPNILRGRIENYNHCYLEQYDHVMQGGGHSHMTAFAPFQAGRFPMFGGARN